MVLAGGWRSRRRASPAARARGAAPAHRRPRLRHPDRVQDTIRRARSPAPPGGRRARRTWPDASRRRRSHRRRDPEDRRTPELDGEPVAERRGRSPGTAGACSCSPRGRRSAQAPRRRCRRRCEVTYELGGPNASVSEGACRQHRDGVVTTLRSAQHDPDARRLLAPEILLVLHALDDDPVGAGFAACRPLLPRRYHAATPRRLPGRVPRCGRYFAASWAGLAAGRGRMKSRRDTV